MKKITICSVIFLFAAYCCAQNVGIGTTTPSAQLHTTGTVRFQGLAGTGIRSISVDADGNLKAALPSFSNNTAGSITSLTCSSPLIKSITVSGLPNSIATTNISVKINCTYTEVNDLLILLKAPNGDVLPLFDGVGFGIGGTNLTNTIFTDNTNQTILNTYPPYTGYLQPFGYLGSGCPPNTATVLSFGAIGGGNINPNGVWQLIVDRQNNNGTGTLDNWSINFSELNTLPGIDNYIPRWKNGFLESTSNIYDDGYKIGIGTTTPSARLSVAGNLNVSSDVLNIATFNSTALSTRLLLSNNAINSFWGANTNFNSAYIGTASSHPFSLQTNGLDRLYVLGNGNVGIGTTSPTSVLHVNGTTKFDGNSDVTGNVTVTGNETISGTLGFGNLLNQNLSANGYAKMGSLIVQWGSGNYSSNTDVTVTFPIAFTNVFSVTATVDAGVGTGSGANVPCKVSAITTTNFKYAGTQVFSGDGVSKVRWMAIGN
jgi:subtilisin-like proprotein convertase family protein